VAIVKDVLVEVEEYIRLSEKLEFYSNKKSEAYFKTIVEIKKDIDFIEKAFAANDVDLAQEIVFIFMQRNECEQDERRKKQVCENTECGAPRFVDRENQRKSHFA
jgi:hypothetical protein